MWVPPHVMGIPRPLQLVSVLCGREKIYGKTTSRKLRRTTHVFDQGFDSVRGGPHFPTSDRRGEDAGIMHVVYRETQVVPEFVITYERLPVPSGPSSPSA